MNLCGHEPFRKTRRRWRGRTGRAPRARCAGGRRFGCVHHSTRTGWRTPRRPTRRPSPGRCQRTSRAHAGGRNSRPRAQTPHAAPKTNGRTLQPRRSPWRAAGCAAISARASGCARAASSPMPPTGAATCAQCRPGSAPCKSAAAGRGAQTTAFCAFFSYSACISCIRAHSLLYDASSKLLA